MCEKALTNEMIWEVEIVQRYAKGNPKFAEEPRELDSVVLIRRLIVSTKTPQEASDLGWAYIEAERIENATVRWITLRDPNFDCVEDMSDTFEIGQDVQLVLDEEGNTHFNPKNGLASMPLDEVGLFYNACTDPCDMLQGPCACGAWHHQEEWPEDLQMRVFGYISSKETICKRFPIPKEGKR